MNLARTRKVITPATRFTATLSYKIFVRMIDFPEETLGRYAALASTHCKRNEPGNGRSWNWKRSDVLQRRKIVKLHILLRLFQERLDMSFQFFGAKDRVVLWIGIPQSG